MNNQLTRLNLPSKRENTYFTILAILAGVAWIAITISIVGLFYAALFAVFIWFTNGLFVARIRSESVEASETQFPALYKAFQDVCSKLGVAQLPRLFVLQAEGALNAFATRHSGRNFVVIYSSLYEGLGSGTDEMRFLIGHEIGHIDRKHLLKRMFLIPASWIPLLGVAYHRAVEETCDRYGTFAAGNVNAAARALTILAAGREPGREAELAGFAHQYYKERGFFVSWHELISSYPTLTQRTHHVLSLASTEYPVRVSRHPLGYLFAFLFSRSTIVILAILYLAFFVGVAVKGVMDKVNAEKAKSVASAPAHSSSDVEEEEYYEDEYSEEDGAAPATK